MTGTAPRPLATGKRTLSEAEQFIAAIIGGHLSLRLPLLANGIEVGTLDPLTQHHLADDDVIQKLTDWRNASTTCFLSQFVATPERTGRWLNDVVLASRRCLLFLVRDSDNRPVGHFGFKSLTEHDVLLDNAMRGERRGHPQLIVLAGRRLIDWLFAETVVDTVYGYVLPDNIPALMLNKQLGFAEWSRVPMVRIDRGSEVHWAFPQHDDDVVATAYCHRVSVHRSQWKQP